MNSKLYNLAKCSTEIARFTHFDTGSIWNVNTKVRTAWYPSISSHDRIEDNLFLRSRYVDGRNTEERKNKAGAEVDTRTFYNRSALLTLHARYPPLLIFLIICKNSMFIIACFSLFGPGFHRFRNLFIPNSDEIDSNNHEIIYICRSQGRRLPPPPRSFRGIVRPRKKNLKKYTKQNWCIANTD